MPRKRKSVTFQENVSMIYPKTFDGSFSPPPNTTTLANPTQPLRLDPMYVSWLHSATRVHLPFVLNGTFATHVYRQNFDEHVKPKTVEDVQRAISREAAVPPLAEKYGSLGWGTLYREVSENAWVRNYREIYRFDGSDEYLLAEMAQAYNDIKHGIAEEENARVQFTQDNSTYGSVSDRQWESFTQGAGALVRPDLRPEDVNVTFDNITDVTFDEDEHIGFGADNRGGNGNGMSFGMDVVSRDFGDAMMSAGAGPRMLSAGPG